MMPPLVDGARLRFRPCRLPLPGDVVAVLSGDSRVLVHRVLGYDLRHGLLLHTGADAHLAWDPATRRSRLVGLLEEIDGVPYCVSPAIRWRALLRFARRAVEVLSRRTSPRFLVRAGNVR